MQPEGDFQTGPLRILDKKVTVLQIRFVGQVKVQWEHYSPEEATWELEDAHAIGTSIFFQFYGALRAVPA